MEDLSRYNPEGSVLRKAQRRMLEIAVEVARICDEHGIPYWINGGTLLGAVRHGGFIPWDDDFDIEVLEKDYAPLLNILERELPSDFVVHIRDNDKNLPCVFGKVREFKFKTEDRESENLRYTGLYIDVFPVEPTFPRLHLWLNRYYVKVYYSLFQRKYNLLLLRSLMVVLKIMAGTVRVVSRITGSRYLMYRFGQNSRQVYTYDMIFPLKKIDFEGVPISCPQDVHRYLVANFGESYMTPPPVEKRVPHFKTIIPLEQD